MKTCISARCLLPCLQVAFRTAKSILSSSIHMQTPAQRESHFHRYIGPVRIFHRAAFDMKTCISARCPLPCSQVACSTAKSMLSSSIHMQTPVQRESHFHRYIGPVRNLHRAAFEMKTCISARCLLPCLQVAFRTAKSILSSSIHMQTPVQRESHFHRYIGPVRNFHREAFDMKTCTSARCLLPCLQVAFRTAKSILSSSIHMQTPVHSESQFNRDIGPVRIFHRAAFDMRTCISARCPLPCLQVAFRTAKSILSSSIHMQTPVHRIWAKLDS